MEIKILKEMKIGKTIVKPGDTIEVIQPSKTNEIWKPEEEVFNPSMVHTLTSTGNPQLDMALKGGLKEHSVLGINAVNPEKTAKFIKNLIKSDQFERIASINYVEAGIEKKMTAETFNELMDTIEATIHRGYDLYIINLVNVDFDDTSDTQWMKKRKLRVALGGVVKYAFGTTSNPKDNPPLVVVLNDMAGDERYYYTVELTIDNSIKISKNKRTYNFDEFEA